MKSLLIILALAAHVAIAQEKFNVVLILADDLGWGDLGCYGNTAIKTPNLDRLAESGVRFTDFYCAGAQCTPSRAGLLTGRYPVRFGLTFALMTDAGYGIPDSETTLAEAFSAAGYATMLSGKWHLGDQPRYHPGKHGFSKFFGLLRGHDTDPRELWRDNKIIEREAPMDTLASRFTDAAAEFIKSSRDRPFFVMLAHTAPHVPLTGSYADAVKEIDDSVGRIVAALRDQKLEEKTMIIFSSDNGPAVDKGKEGGSPGPFRAGKYSTYEGGIRVPAIIAMPGKIKPRVESTPACLIDIFPAIAPTGAKPANKLDGVSLAPLLFEFKPPAERPLYFYFRDELQACRLGKWKLKLEKDAAQLFDLETDLGETKNVADDQRDLVARIRELIKNQQSAAKPR